MFATINLEEKKSILLRTDRVNGKIKLHRNVFYSKFNNYKWPDSVLHAQLPPSFSRKWYVDTAPSNT